MNLDKYKRSKLHYICIDLDVADRSSAIEALVDEGVDINLQDLDGWTALHFAAQEQDSRSIELLIQHGASTELVDKNGNSALWVATMNSDQKNEAISLLLKSGSDYKRKNNHGISPFDISPEFFTNP